MQCHAFLNGQIGIGAGVESFQETYERVSCDQIWKVHHQFHTSGSQSSPTISSNIMVSGLLLIARILDWVVRAIFLGLGLL